MKCMITIDKAQKQNLFSRTNAKTSSTVSLWTGGVAFTFLFALLAYSLAKVPGFNHIGPLACSIIMAVIYRQILGYPEKIRSGIEFSSKKLLRYAIVLYGLKLNIAVVIALVGTLFAIGYTILRPYIHLTNIQYGIWSGVGLHEIAHVALAAAPAGRDALAIGLLAKLGRVLLLVPLSFILMYWMKRTGKIEKDTKIEFPWFLIGFIIMSIFGSYVVGKHLIIPKTIMNDISTLTTFLLTMAMVGLGLNVSMKALRTKALKPLIAMFITSILLSFLTFWTM